VSANRLTTSSVLAYVSVQDWRQTLRYEQLPKFAAWGLGVSPSMMQLEARVLNPPSITYGNNKQLRAMYG